jgi:hypothetical protein
LSLPLELHLGLGQLGFVGPDEVLLEPLVDDEHALFDNVWVVRRAVLAEQELENVDRNVVPDLDPANEILPDDLAFKELIGHTVEVVEFRCHQINPRDRRRT